MRHIFVVAGVLAGGALLACAPALSTFQPAHVAPAGHVLAEGGVEVGIPTGSILTGIDTAKDLGQRAQSGEMLTDGQKLQILDAGVNLAVNSPSVGPHLGIAYTVVDRVEANVRFAGQAFRFGGRYQILKRDTGPFDMTVGLGVSRFSYEFPLSDTIPVLALDDFSRWQIDVPVLIGTSNDFMRVWLGPKLLVSWFQTQMTLSIPNQPVSVARFDGTATYLGGQGGLALGYRHVFFAVELTIAQSFGSAHTTVTAFSTPSHDTHISTLIVYPSVGLMLERYRMAFSTRVFCREGTIPTLTELLAWQRQHGTPVMLVEGGSAADLLSPFWTRAVLSYDDGEEPFTLRCDHAGDSAGAGRLRDELADFLADLAELPDDEARARVIDHLQATRFLLVVEFPEEGVSPRGYETNGWLMALFVERAGGMVQCDGIGFYDADDEIILRLG